MGSLGDCRGRWRGHYLWYGWEFPILADLAQSGVDLSGRMSDLKPTWDLSPAEMIARGAADPSLLEIFAQLGAGLPRYPGRPRVFFELFPTATLAGGIDGTTVRFRKTYDGPSSNKLGFVDAEGRVTIAAGQDKPAHTVHYQGQIDFVRGRIEGTWSVQGTPSDGEDASDLEGPFLLVREGGLN